MNYGEGELDDISDDGLQISDDEDQNNYEIFYIIGAEETENNEFNNNRDDIPNNNENVASVGDIEVDVKIETIQENVLCENQERAQAVCADLEHIVEEETTETTGVDSYDVVVSCKSKENEQTGDTINATFVVENEEQAHDANEIFYESEVQNMDRNREQSENTTDFETQVKIESFEYDTEEGNLEHTQALFVIDNEVERTHEEGKHNHYSADFDTQVMIESLEEGIVEHTKAVCEIDEVQQINSPIEQIDDDLNERTASDVRDEVEKNIEQEQNTEIEIYGNNNNNVNTSTTNVDINLSIEVENVVEDAAASVRAAVECYMTHQLSSLTVEVLEVATENISRSKSMTTEEISINKNIEDKDDKNEGNTLIVCNDSDMTREQVHGIVEEYLQSRSMLPDYVESKKGELNGVPVNVKRSSKLNGDAAEPYDGVKKIIQSSSTDIQIVAVDLSNVISNENDDNKNNNWDPSDTDVKIESLDENLDKENHDILICDENVSNEDTQCSTAEVQIVGFDISDAIDKEQDSNNDYGNSADVTEIKIESLDVDLVKESEGRVAVVCNELTSQITEQENIVNEETQKSIIEEVQIVSVDLCNVIEKKQDNNHNENAAHVTEVKIETIGYDFFQEIEENAYDTRQETDCAVLESEVQNREKEVLTEEERNRNADDFNIQVKMVFENTIEENALNEIDIIQNMIETLQIEEENVSVTLQNNTKALPNIKVKQNDTNPFDTENYDVSKKIEDRVENEEQRAACEEPENIISREVHANNTDTDKGQDIENQLDTIDVKVENIKIEEGVVNIEDNAHSELECLTGEEVQKKSSRPSKEKEHNEDHLDTIEVNVESIKTEESMVNVEEDVWDGSSDSISDEVPSVIQIDRDRINNKENNIDSIEVKIEEIKSEEGTVVIEDYAHDVNDDENNEVTAVFPHEINETREKDIVNSELLVKEGDNNLEVLLNEKVVDIEMENSLLTNYQELKSIEEKESKNEYNWDATEALVEVKVEYSEGVPDFIQETVDDELMSSISKQLENFEREVETDDELLRNDTEQSKKIKILSNILIYSSHTDEIQNNISRLQNPTLELPRTGKPRTIEEILIDLKGEDLNENVQYHSDVEDIPEKKRKCESDLKKHVHTENMNLSQPSIDLKNVTEENFQEDNKEIERDGPSDLIIELEKKHQLTTGHRIILTKPSTSPSKIQTRSKTKSSKSKFEVKISSKSQLHSIKQDMDTKIGSTSTVKPEEKSKSTSEDKNKVKSESKSQNEKKHRSRSKNRISKSSEDKQKTGDETLFLRPAHLNSSETENILMSDSSNSKDNQKVQVKSKKGSSKSHSGELQSRSKSKAKHKQEVQIKPISKSVEPKTKSHKQSEVQSDYKFKTIPKQNEIESKVNQKSKLNTHSVTQHISHSEDRIAVQTKDNRHVDDKQQPDAKFERKFSSTQNLGVQLDHIKSPKSKRNNNKQSKSKRKLETDQNEAEINEERKVPLESTQKADYKDKDETKIASNPKSYKSQIESQHKAVLKPPKSDSDDIISRKRKHNSKEHETEAQYKSKTASVSLNEVQTKPNLKSKLQNDHIRKSRSKDSHDQTKHINIQSKIGQKINSKSDGNVEKQQIEFLKSPSTSKADIQLKPKKTSHFKNRTTIQTDALKCLKFQALDPKLKAKTPQNQDVPHFDMSKSIKVQSKYKPKPITDRQDAQIGTDLKSRVQFEDHTDTIQTFKPTKYPDKKSRIASKIDHVDHSETKSKSKVHLGTKIQSLEPHTEISRSEKKAKVNEHKLQSKKKHTDTDDKLKSHIKNNNRLHIDPKLKSPKPQSDAHHGSNLKSPSRPKLKVQPEVNKHFSLKSDKKDKTISEDKPKNKMESNKSSTKNKDCIQIATKLKSPTKPQPSAKDPGPSRLKSDQPDQSRISHSKDRGLHNIQPKSKLKSPLRSHSKTQHHPSLKSPSRQPLVIEGHTHLQTPITVQPEAQHPPSLKSPSKQQPKAKHHVSLKSPNRPQPEEQHHLNLKSPIRAQSETQRRRSLQSPSKQQPKAKHHVSLKSPTRPQPEEQHNPNLKSPIRAQPDEKHHLNLKSSVRAQPEAKPHVSLKTPIRPQTEDQFNPNLKSPIRAQLEAQHHPILKSPSRQQPVAMQYGSLKSPRGQQPEAQYDASLKSPTRSQHKAYEDPSIKSPVRSKFYVETDRRRKSQSKDHGKNEEETKNKSTKDQNEVQKVLNLISHSQHEEKIFNDKNEVQIDPYRKLLTHTETLNQSEIKSKDVQHETHSKHKLDDFISTSSEHLESKRCKLNDDNFPKSTPQSKVPTQNQSNSKADYGQKSEGKKQTQPKKQPYHDPDRKHKTYVKKRMDEVPSESSSKSQVDKNISNLQTAIAQPKENLHTKDHFLIKVTFQNDLVDAQSKSTLTNPDIPQAEFISPAQPEVQPQPGPSSRSDALFDNEPIRPNGTPKRGVEPQSHSSHIEQNSEFPGSKVKKDISIKKFNKKLGTFQCPTCPKKLSTKKKLDMHFCKMDGKLNYCYICERTLSDYEVFKRHLLIHFGTKEYRCRHCGKEFSYAISLAVHKRIHTGIKPFPCTVCTKAFYKKSTLVAHEKRHKIGKPYACKVCNSAFNSRENYLGHECVHPMLRRFLCDTCSKAYATRNSLIAHIDWHANSNQFECKYCKKVYSARSLLLTHNCPNKRKDKMTIETSKVKEVSANSESNQELSTSPEAGPSGRKEVATAKRPIDNGDHGDIPDLERNTTPIADTNCGEDILRTKHQNDKDNDTIMHKKQKTTKDSITSSNDNTCTEKFETIDKVVTNEDLYSCNTCDKIFNDSLKLRKHTFKHTNTSLICDICKRSFKSKTTLIRHINGHFDRSYECEMCGDKFTTKADSTSHVLEYGGLKYPCETCNAGFAIESSLLIHREVCGKPFQK